MYQHIDCGGCSGGDSPSYANRAQRDVCHAFDAVHDVALLEDQVSVAVPPALVEAWSLVSVTAGTTPVTVAVCVTEFVPSVKPLAAFFDCNLRDGAGGHGRICLQCKGGSVPHRKVKKWRR